MVKDSERERATVVVAAALDCLTAPCQCWMETRVALRVEGKSVCTAIVTCHCAAGVDIVKEWNSHCT